MAALGETIADAADGRGCVLRVRVIPRARRTALDGLRGGALLVRLAAPPVDDAANEALVRFVAELMGVQARAVQLVAGQRARDKRVGIDGVTRVDAIQRITRALAGSQAEN